MHRIQLELAAFAQDRAGDVAMTFGLMAIAMFLFMGAAVDYSRWLHARDQTIAAVDAAVLAAGRTLQLNPDDETLALAMADRYYAENTQKRADLFSDTIAFKTEDNGLSVTAEGAAYIGTTFLNLAGIDRLPLLKVSGAEFSKAVLAVGGNAETNLEIAMMLDTSGSMGANNKLEDMQDAAADLVNIIVWADQSTYTSKVSIAPFSADVRPAASILSAVRGTGPFNPISYSYTCGSKKSGYSTCTETYEVTSCVAERKGAQKYTDAAPAAGQFVMAAYEANGSCSQPVNDSVMPLSSDKTALTNKINGLTIGGGTSGHLGTAWAWYTISPNWNSVWPSNSAANYGAPHTQKIAILMTDGEYNTQYDTNGIKTSASGAGSAVNANSKVQALALCTGMKTAGITVYTIGFDLGGNQTAIDTLHDCATDPAKFYNAVDGSQLKQAFRDIALKLSALHLTR